MKTFITKVNAFKQTVPGFLLTVTFPLAMGGYTLVEGNALLGSFCIALGMTNILLSEDN